MTDSISDIILKRTTLIVRDAERMKDFYEQVLGWTVSYSSEMELSGGILPCGKPGDRVKLYMMQGADPEIAKIGLLEWLDPKLPDPGPPPHRLGIGNVVLVADVPDMTALMEKVDAFPGAKIHFAPEDGTFPDPRGEGTIEFSNAAMFDPEGFFYELYYRYNRPNPEQFLIRRTTCIVRDLDRTLDFFTNTLGLQKIQDSTMDLEGMLAAGKAGDTVRFAVCKAEHDYYGMAAGLQFLKDPLDDPGDATWKTGIGSAVFVAGTRDATGMFDKIKASGVKVTRDLFSRAVPKTGGQGETAMHSMGFHDPDGFVWEVNQREDGK
ncbi:MAG: VOC family protein [Rhodospirillaceae bacterium]|nr:VOC family protein [Rhodospirillaceae bacterium]